MDISQFIASIDATVASLGQAPLSDADRQQLLAASKRLQEASESPLDAVASIVLGVNKHNIPPKWVARANGNHRSIVKQLSEQLLTWDSSLLSSVPEKQVSLPRSWQKRPSLTRSSSPVLWELWRLLAMRRNWEFGITQRLPRLDTLHLDLHSLMWWLICLSPSTVPSTPKKAKLPTGLPTRKPSSNSPNTSA